VTRVGSDRGLIAKRLLDLTLASFGLLLLSPLLAAIAVAIPWGSRGPVFYRGWRTGQSGKPFRIFKFRTMTVGAEAQGTTTAMNDARVTRLGKHLRRWKFDELPQLINVILGDMSLVGPRPEVEEHTSAYTAEEQAILSVRPGITDLASIRFVRLTEELGTEDPHSTYVNRLRAEKNALRLRYVRERSFVGDLRILCRTLWVIMAPKRAGPSPS
jgi:lipopolysaccharide/colanic/teichoic acid biosynthesis glycosyltransferase